MRKTVLFLLLAALAGTAWAALPPRSDAELWDDSELIVSGRILNIYQATVPAPVGTNHSYVATVAIDSVEKGAGVDVGDLLYVHYWQAAQRPAGWAGPVGQNQLPAAGNDVRLYLQRRWKHYELLEPNGWKLLPGHP
jgi:hypothetical protein